MIFLIITNIHISMTMKKNIYVFATMLAVAFTSCGNQSNPTTVNASAEEQEPVEINRSLSTRLDSLTSCWLRLNQAAFFASAQCSNVLLSSDNKKVKPDYLADPATIEPLLETLCLKYRALAVFQVDRSIAELYDMRDVYTPSLKKISAQLNDPAIELLQNAQGDYSQIATQIYNMEEESGRVSMFWQMAASYLIEQLFVLTKSENMILASLTDQEADELTMRLSVLVDTFADLARYEPELASLYDVLKSLQKINAVTVDELRGQLDSVKADIENARKALFI